MCNKKGATPTHNCRGGASPETGPEKVLQVAVVQALCALMAYALPLADVQDLSLGYLPTNVHF